LVADAVDLVVFSQRGADGPKVSEILAVEDLAGSPESGAFTVTDVFTRSGSTGELKWTGDAPHRLARTLAANGQDMLAVLDAHTGRPERSERKGSRP
jgi:pilus assembly protein CpaF